MTTNRNPWMNFAVDAVRLGLEAQDVIGLRLLKSSWGGFDAGEEALLMVMEKGQAAWDANFLITKSLIAGQGHLAPARTLALYRRRVQANHRRLMKGG